MLLKQQQLLEIKGFNVGDLVAENIQTFPQAYIQPLSWVAALHNSHYKQYEQHY